MNNERPANVKWATLLAVIGGLVSIAFLAASLMNAEAAGTFVTVGFAMVIAVLFFGIAGQLYPHGMVNYAPLIILNIINIVAVTGSVIFDSNNLGFGIPLFVLAALVDILLLAPVTERWVHYDRI